MFSQGSTKFTVTFLVAKHDLYMTCTIGAPSKKKKKKEEERGGGGAVYYLDW